MHSTEKFIFLNTNNKNTGTKMKITIDTKEDSPDDIKRVIKMLSSLVGQAGEVFSNQGDIFKESGQQQSASDSGASVFDMFSSQGQEAKTDDTKIPDKETKGKAPEFTIDDLEEY